MSQNEQEETAADTGIPAVPGHQGGAPKPADGASGERRSRAADKAGAGHPDHIEPRAGRDK